eukprot:6492769-Amphidinium_carterae.5
MLVLLGFQGKCSSIARNFQVSHVYLREYEACARLDRGQHWTAVWWQLEGSERPLPVLDPQFVSVVPWSPQTQQVWPILRKKQERLKHGRSRGSTGRHRNPHSPCIDVPDASDATSGTEASAGQDSQDDTSTNTNLLLRAEILQDWVEDLAQVATDEHIVNPVGAHQSLAQAPGVNGQLDETQLVALPATSSALVSADSTGGSTLNPLLLPDSRLRGSQSTRISAVRDMYVGAEVTVAIANGRLSYYPSKSAFEAVCGNRLHGRCVMTRSSNARRGGQLGGRPVAFLCCFLANCNVESKEQHFLKSNLLFTREQRLSWRENLKGLPEGRLLLGLERKKNADEDSEPESLTGYL